jgi:hypothetical protein
MEGFVPNLDAFVFDAADPTGFELVQGQRQSLLLNSSVLEAGTWYVGVYNIWGHNGADGMNSQDTARYTLKANLYDAGTPCPATRNGFCDGFACDFNTGRCDCPPDRLWRDCSFPATALPRDGSVVAPAAPLEVSYDAYFLVEISEDDVASGLNLLLSLDMVDEAATQRATMRAAFGDLPFAGNVGEFSDHDLLSNFYGDAHHEILLDAEELAAAGPGVWYLSVANGIENSAPFSYTVKAAFAAALDCPKAHGSGLECSDAGACERALGRCDCDPGNVLDDCSADGVFDLASTGGDASAELGNAPPIAVDDWAYWSVNVGCDDRRRNRRSDFNVSPKSTIRLQRERLRTASIGLFCRTSRAR